MTEPIPSPRGLPVLGNLLDLQDEVPLLALGRMLDVYGPIVQFKVPGATKIAVGGYELFNELCDETRFYKLLSGPLVSGALKPRGAEGLFTAKSEESEDWAQAHRILMPAFGPLAIEEMFSEMHDIASQMVLKWARQGPQHRILATDDFSRLTLDTIALCAMDYRFNSFYQEDMHPFVKSMTNVLTNSSNSQQLSGMLKSMLPSHREQMHHDREVQEQICSEVVEHRRANPTERKDLLNAMLHGKDPKTGNTMRDKLIAANMQTFLIAGHETTSGLLSFAFSQMLKNPRTFFAAQQEVDRVVGAERIEPKHLKSLDYINAVLRETLRLTPTAPAFQRAVRPQNREEKVTIGGGRYEIPRGQSIICNLMKIHTDPKVWGDDAQEFKPERMLDGKFERLPKNAWKPFGTGLRSCIGRAFAWQEALLATAMILQNFNVELVDPEYDISMVQSLTIKPKDFYIRASLRPGITSIALQHRLESVEVPHDIRQASDTDGPSQDDAPGMTILYGSNTGTCQALAQKLSSEAAQHGIRATVNEMDSSIDKLPKGSPVVVITSSYEGQPPDNAARFVAWLDHLGERKSLDGIDYAVFGCGHSDWASTYQRIPCLVDELQAKAGGHQLTPRGEADASKGDIYAEFEAWTSGSLWPAISASIDLSNASGAPSGPAIEMEISKAERAAHLQQNVQWADVVETRSLTTSGDSEKRHITFQLPPGMSYSTGDYTVRRTIKHFGLPFDGVVTIKKSGSTTLPTGKPVSIFDLLRGYVEISQPATRKVSQMNQPLDPIFILTFSKDVEMLVSRTKEASEQETLRAMVASDDAFKEQVADRRITVLDLLTKFPSADVPFPTFLALLPPLRPRYYSISSSPIAEADRCSLTYSVIDAPSWSGVSGGRFQGVAGTYLRSLKRGDQALVAVRSTNPYFRPPPDPESTPVVMVCAGSGLAPFRAFVQERAVLMREGGRALAPALLFVGCRNPTADRLYAEELDAWRALGAVDVRYAFSRDPNASEGCAYIQDRLLHDRADVVAMWDAGARFYICGGRAVARGVGKAASLLIVERARERGEDLSDEAVADFKMRIKNERFVSDIFD